MTVERSLFRGGVHYLNSPGGPRTVDGVGVTRPTRIDSDTEEETKEDSLQRGKVTVYSITFVIFTSDTTHRWIRDQDFRITRTRLGNERHTESKGADIFLHPIIVTNELSQSHYLITPLTVFYELWYRPRVLKTLFTIDDDKEVQCISDNRTKIHIKLCLIILK